jgi:2-polyprenyl-3-methyl-5-hydroxy-6-metoxy-1,4-benzoquinol methylase
MPDKVTGLLSPFLRERRIRAALPHISGRVLDYGCGIGMLADRATYSSYTGVDADAESLTIARRHRPALRFLSIAEIPDEMFDTITMLAVIEYVVDRSATLAALRRRLAPDGRIVMTTPTPKIGGLRQALAAFGLVSGDIREAEESLPDERTLRRDAAAAGLAVAHYERFLLGANQLLVLRTGEGAGIL